MQSTAPVRQLLRLATAGSVDDGKSTLIGRLLHDTGSLPEDQLAAVTAESGEIDLAAVTDGLRAEAEQGITIDVAYRYFSTEDRDYILADTPGHERYTRNMFTGTSTADVSVILVDARAGVVRQTRRHAVIAHLLGVRHVIAAVNKMDLVGLDSRRFDEVRDQLHDLAERIGIPDLLVIPVVAKDGDNIVRRSERTPWYDGPILLERLESVEPSEGAGRSPDVRLPVQQVIRPPGGGRRYAGRLASGTLQVGDVVTVLPEGACATVRAIDVLGEPSERVVAPRSLAVELSEDLDVGRGDLIAGGPNAPLAVRELVAVVCWMGEEPLREGARLLVKHTARWVLAQVAQIRHRLDAEELVQEPHPGELRLNDIGEVVLRLAGDVVVDPYQQNRETGSFILVDELSNETVGAGCVTEGRPAASGAQTRAPALWAPPVRPAAAPAARVLWAFGADAALSAARAADTLAASGQPAYALDVRAQLQGLSSDLPGSATDLAEHRRRVAYVALVLADAGVVPVVADPDGQERDLEPLRGLASLAGKRLDVLAAE
ncbi:sulfate adenylyltransferase, large subunit [Segniliparus rotundus DSM 44985]|uniref:sulfate adenylyltransferase n=1 Tax=Segniliparus rotundus (strain ATCC BAA-972 / CDC 1076 / CIP 108378 / DSM 44985 / JCM 13578) TaxID=640132 RepID=D6ZCE9_SEGRD|nr:GTP-binding protein [Segniliparus rotundus]ADG99118.1 sulfate adenylyltransferase, large subunit [Segniliparus rotundus DSM 44985]